MRLFPSLTLLLTSASLYAAPLPIDPLWKSETFRRSVTASYGIDSRIEPVITADEASYLGDSAKAMADGDRAKAIAILKDSSLLEQSAAMQFNLASLQFEAGDATACIDHFEAALKLYPNFRDAHRNLAIVLIQTGKVDAAQPHLDRALALGSLDGTTLGLLAYARAVKGNHQAALDAYRLAQLTQPDERQWKLGEAQSLLALNHAREAADLVQGMLKQTPEEMNLWRLQADAWMALENNQHAITDLEIVYRTGTLDANATLTLAHLCVQDDLPDLAIERYRSALTAIEPAPAIRALEGIELFLSREDWTHGKEMVTILDQSDFYRKAFDLEKGEKSLVSRMVRAKAILELETGDRASGAKLLEDWTRREPLDGAALILLARFRSESNQTPEAEMLLEQAERIPESSADAYYDHARIRIGASDYEKGLELLRKSQEIRPRESLAQYIVAIQALIGGSPSEF